MDKRAFVFKIVLSTLLIGLIVSWIAVSISSILESNLLMEQLSEYQQSPSPLSDNFVLQYTLAHQKAIGIAVSYIFLSAISALAIVYIWLKDKKKSKSES